MTDNFPKYAYYKLSDDVYRLEDYNTPVPFCSYLKRGRKGKWVWGYADNSIFSIIEKEGVEIKEPILENVFIKDGKKEVKILEKPIIEIKQMSIKQNQTIKETNQPVKETDELIVIGNETSGIKYKEKKENNSLNWLVTTSAGGCVVVIIIILIAIIVALSGSKNALEEEKSQQAAFEKAKNECLQEASSCINTLCNVNTKYDYCMERKGYINK